MKMDWRHSILEEWKSALIELGGQFVGHCLMRTMLELYAVSLDFLDVQVGNVIISRYDHMACYRSFSMLLQFQPEQFLAN